MEIICREDQNVQSLEVVAPEEEIFHLQLYVTFWKEDVKGVRISDELVTWYNNSPTCPHRLQTVAQPDCCATKFQTCLKIVKLLHKQSNHATQDQIVCARSRVVQTV